MSSEFENITDEPKDRTKWIWLGIIIVLCVMIAMIMRSGPPTPSTSAVEVQHILIGVGQGQSNTASQALDLVQRLRERILNGESFAKLAREYSDDPQSRLRGGNLGLSEKGLFEENFEEYVWTAEIGKLSPPIKTNFGYHLIIVNSRFVHPADEYEKEIFNKALEELQKGKQSTEGSSEGASAPE